MQKRLPTIFEAFGYVCKKYPRKDAIYFKQADGVYASLTYQELHKHSTLLSSFLKKNNIKQSSPVAIMMDNGPYWPIAFLGIVRMGAVAIPLNPEEEIQELAQLISASECKIILTSKSLEEKVRATIRSLPIFVAALDSQDIIKEINASEGWVGPEGDFPCEHIASIIYTSGTASAPKGVILSHKNYLANVESLSRLGLIASTDCLACLLPLYHSYPLVVSLLLPLLSGARISFIQGFDPEEIMDSFQRTRVTVLVGVPRILALFHKKLSDNIANRSVLRRFFLSIALGLLLPLRKYIGLNLAKRLLASLHRKMGEKLRIIISGGAMLDKGIAYNLYKWGFTIVESYGLSEASAVVTLSRPGDFRPGCVGKAIPGVAIDKRVGEIIVKGENVSTGYYKDAELTMQNMRDGWLYTRDLGNIDKKGFIFITGNKDEVIALSSGKKINPEALESYYARSFYIKEICIFLPETGRSDAVLNAVVVPNLEYFRIHNVSQVKERIRWEIENLSRELPVYRRIQKYIVTECALPRTILGKIRRFEVKKVFSEGSPSEKKALGKELSERDKHLLSFVLCRQALDYLSEKFKKPVSLDDHLEFDLGLDSLERICLFFEFQKLSGFEMDEKLFFYVSTVRDVLSKLQRICDLRLNTDEDESLSWSKILNAPPKKQEVLGVVGPQGFLGRAANGFFLAILFMASRLFFRLKIKGRDNLPSAGPYLLCPNHSSYLDAPLLAASLSLSTLLDTYFLGYSAYIDHPLISWAKNLFRLFPIDPATKLTDTLTACSFILKNSKILCMFPEGIRSVDGEIQEFKRGVGILIKELNMAVVPVYIKGAHKAWPPYKAFPSPGKIEVIFGKKLTAQELSAEKIENIDIYQNIADNLSKELVKLQEL